MKLSVVCLNAGNYLGRGLNYVVSLQQMVARHLNLPHDFVVFTDDEADYPSPIVKRPLPHPGLTGWYNKIALFKPGIFAEGERVLYLDLDTLICGPIDDIAAYDGMHARLAPFFHGLKPEFAGPQSGIMAWQGGFGAHIWKAYEATGFPQNLKGGDQYFLNKIHPQPDLWQEMFPGKIGSFKGEGGIIQPERSILCFHGLPRMHQVFPHGWGSETTPAPVVDGGKLLGGFWWPEADLNCWCATLAVLDEDVAQALNFTPRRGTCIQAGGNVGAFAARFARHFEIVRTFEPDDRNFHFLRYNAGYPNVRPYLAALGETSGGTVSLIDCVSNIGKVRVDPGGIGCIPLMAIDDLNTDCDLIYLDLEGYEMKALRGAADTIRRCRPTVVIEDNGLSECYGVPQGETPAWLCREFGYSIAAQTGRDVILIPER